jgi:hypothetical protein
MSNMVFGEVDWNAADSSASKSDFMRTEEGENTVRVMGNPVQFYIHWITGSDGSKAKINSPANNPELVSRLEDAGFRRQARWLIKVLDRSDDTFRLLEVGPQIYNGVKSLFNNSRWGKVTAYDITINRAKPGTQPLYSVTPNPKESLSSDFKSRFMEFNDRVNLEKIISPSTAEEVCSKMGWKQGSQTSEDSAAGDEDFDFDFE